MELLTIDEVQAIINTKKLAVREIEWVKKSFSESKLAGYETAFRVENEKREDVFMKARWRAKKL